MSCLPGTPCYNHGTVVYPRGCGIDPCYTHKTGTDLVFYNGANLPCVGVDTCDSVTLALQKIDQKLCPDALALAVLGSITNNLSIRNMFCALVTGCIPTTTTTTSTIVPTTTTTTSIASTTTTTTSAAPTTTTTTSSSSTTTTTTSSSSTTTTTTSITPTTTTTTSSSSTTTTTTTATPTTTTTTTVEPTTTTTTTTTEPTPEFNIVYNKASTGYIVDSINVNGFVPIVISGTMPITTSTTELNTLQTGVSQTLNISITGFTGLTGCITVIDSMGNSTQDTVLANGLYTFNGLIIDNITPVQISDVDGDCA